MEYRYQEYPRIVYHKDFAPRIVDGDEAFNQAIADGFTKLPADHFDPRTPKEEPGSGFERWGGSDWTSVDGDGLDYPHERGTGNPTVEMVAKPTVPSQEDADRVVAEVEAEIAARRDSDGVFKKDKTIIEDPSTNDVDKDKGGQ